VTSAVVFMVSMRSAEGVAVDVARIDGVVRQAADAVSRRSSLLALSGTVLVAALARSELTAAKQKAGKKVKKKCRQQETQCRSFYEGFCGDNQFCLGDFPPCCVHLARCDAFAFLQCRESIT
jgi:hypothetical protein